MKVVTPPPVQRGVLRPSQHTPSNPSILKLLLHFNPVSSFHHLQSFPIQCSYNTSSGPSFSPTSLISGASIYFENSKPERAWEEEGNTFMLPLLFFKRRTGQKRSDFDPWQTPPQRRGRRVLPVPSEARGESSPRSGLAGLCQRLSRLC